MATTEATPVPKRMFRIGRFLFVEPIRGAVPNKADPVRVVLECDGPYQAIDHARRIAALWNAFPMLSTETLERMAADVERAAEAPR